MRRTSRGRRHLRPEQPGRDGVLRHDPRHHLHRPALPPQPGFRAAGTDDRDGADRVHRRRDAGALSACRSCGTGRATSSCFCRSPRSAWCCCSSPTPAAPISRCCKNIRNLPVRLLSTGMLLTILLGALGALVVFRAALDLGGGHPRRHPRADGCRARADHRQQPARADEDPPGAQRGGRPQRRSVRAVPAVLHRAGERWRRRPNTTA